MAEHESDIGRPRGFFDEPHTDALADEVLYGDEEPEIPSVPWQVIEQKHRGFSGTLEEVQAHYAEERRMSQVRELKMRQKTRREVVLVPNHEWVVEDRPKWEKGQSTRVRARLLVNNKFHREHAGVETITKDVPDRFHPHPSFATEEDYIADIIEQGNSGHPISSELGTLQIAGEECMVVTTNAEVSAGAMDEPAGDNVVTAARRGRHRKKSLVAIVHSGGVNVKKGIAGLKNSMEEATLAIERFNKESGQVSVGVLTEKNYGGAAGGFVPRLHITIGMAGGDSGFASKNIFGAYQGIPTSETTQSNEAAVLDYRTVTVLARDEKQVQLMLDRIIKLTTNKHRLSKREARQLPPLEEKSFVRFAGPRKIFNSLDQEDPPEWLFPIAQPKEFEYPSDDLYKCYQGLESDARRPDSEWLMYQMCKKGTMVPLYNNVGLHRPNKIFALGEIEGTGTTVLFGADQVSYEFDRENPDQLIRLAANNTPSDRAIWQRMVEFAHECNIPFVSLIGTTGENSLPSAEARGLVNAVSDSIVTTQGNEDSVGVLIDIGGSGGYLASKPKRLFVGEDTQTYVAPPAEGARITQKTQNPTEDQIRDHAQLSEPTAAQLYAKKLVDGVVYFPNGGPIENPMGMAEAIRNLIAQEIAA